MKKLTKIIIAGLISTSALSAFADSSANSASAAAPKSFALKVRGGYANNSLKHKPLSGTYDNSQGITDPSQQNPYIYREGNRIMGAKNGFGLELAANYFITNNVAVEASLGYIASKFKVEDSYKEGRSANNANEAKNAAQNAATNKTLTILSSTMHIVPIEIALQYHFMPDSSFKPYVGVGYGIEFVKIAGVKNSLKSNGLVLQIGTDVAYNDSMSFNFDVKYKPNHKVKVVGNKKVYKTEESAKISTTTIMAGVSFPF